MAEAHEPLALVERLLDPLLRTLDRAHLVELLDDLRRRTAVERAFQRPDRARNGRCQVAPRRDDDAGGERRRVEPVLGADDEVGIERSRRAGVRLRAGELVQTAARRVDTGARRDLIRVDSRD